MAANTNRYTVLDSYRALAALYVVCFHYFYRWSELPTTEQLIPSTPILSSSAVVQYGYLGVEFFFIISGFVIALTLNSTRTISDFAVKRFARLFPAMLICAGFTFAVVKLLAVEPFSEVGLVDFLPSLTFISPQVFNKLLGLESDWISGVYWSLFIEVKFYFYAAIIYFLSPKRFLTNFFWFSFGLCAVYWVSVTSGHGVVANLLDILFFPKYVFLFVAGMTFQSAHRSEGKPTNVVVAIGVFSLIYSVFVYSPLNPVQSSNILAMAMIVVFYALFVLFVIDARVLVLLKFRLLAKIGAASYSLYLLHESVGVSVIRRLNEDVLSSGVWPFVAIVMVVILSIVFYEFIETPARRIIRDFYASRHPPEH